MITLYYVRGLTRLDEPVFDSVENQTTFFKAHKVTEIDTGFYPPHFKNAITLSTEDADFTKTINYLSLTYSNKEYYYFVDSIEYISEDVITINITMDTIQTYMFNILFNESIITKQSIKRWIKTGSSYLINRHYIRENLSHEDFIVDTYSKTRDAIGWYIVWIRSGTDIYTASSDSSPIETPNNIKLYLNKGDALPIYTIYKTPLFIPVSMVSIHTSFNLISGTSAVPATSLIDMFTDLSSVLQIVFVPFDIMKNMYTSTESTTTLNLNFTDSGLSVKNVYIKTGNTYRAIGGVVYPATLNTGLYLYSNTKALKNYTDAPYLTVSRNTSINKDFSPLYVPALVDENYMQIEYGEQQSRASYPLYELTVTNLYGHVMYDLVSGTRIYYIDTTSTAGVNINLRDSHDTMTICNTIEQVDLYTSAWNEYYSRNSATWTIGYALNKEKIAYKAVTDSVSNVGSTISGVTSSPTPWGMIGSAIKGVVNQGLTVADTFQNQYVLDEERKITKLNLEYTPDTQKQGNTLTADFLDGAFNIITRTKRVRDIVQVAYKYERNGYRVNYNVYNENLFNYNYRYYYDIIQANVLNLNFINTISDENMIVNLKSRFASGLRLWHTKNGALLAENIATYKYDNVEVDFIEEE